MPKFFLPLNIMQDATLASQQGERASTTFVMLNMRENPSGNGEEINRPFFCRFTRLCITDHFETNANFLSCQDVAEKIRPTVNSKFKVTTRRRLASSAYKTTNKEQLPHAPNSKLIYTLYLICFIQTEALCCVLNESCFLVWSFVDFLESLQHDSTL